MGDTFEMEVLKTKETEFSGSDDTQDSANTRKQTSSEKWEDVRLREVVRRRSENVDPSESDLNRHVGLEHISSDHPIPDYESVEGQSSTKRHFLPGDVLFGKLRPYLRKAAQPDFEGLCTSEIFPIVADEVINAKFLLYRLSSKRAFDYATRTSIGTRMPRTSWGLFKNLEFRLPPLPEQRKIASVLYAVDQAIQKTEAIIEQANRVKRGLMQDLFTHGLGDQETRKIRPGEFPKSWDFTTLGKVTYVERGNTPDTNNESYYGGETVWVTPNDLSILYENRGGKYISDSERKLTEAGVQSKSLTLVSPNSVMFTSRSYGIGKTAICTVPAVVNQGITAFECGDHLDEEFLYYYLNHIMEYIVSISGVATFPEITKREVEGIPVPIPDRNEQSQIVAPLKSLDERIHKESKLKERLKRLKKGLMQDLLTGEVRTADKAIEVLDKVAAHG